MLNKTMDRDDLTCSPGKEIVDELNELVRRIYQRGFYMSSWYGTLPGSRDPELGQNNWQNRGDGYVPLPGAEDDRRLPWYLYWEIVWVCQHGPEIRGARVLDAGGASSLCSCYLASKGARVRSVELKRDLADNANALASAMRWNMEARLMDMRKMTFPAEHFDHAYSICVLEHLDLPSKHEVLGEIVRVLKPGGMLCLTFDYRNPAPFVHGVGTDTRRRNQLLTPADVERSFYHPAFEVVGNRKFHDNGKVYLIHPKTEDAYTFGSLFLRKRGDDE